MKSIYQVPKATPRPEKDILQYPCIRVTRENTFAVLFTSSTEGTVIWSNPNHRIRQLGEHYDDFFPAERTDDWKNPEGTFVLE